MAGLKEVTLYTDGACSNNPGPGGWGAVLLYRGYRLEISGGCEATTNNRMELQAAIEGLKRLKEPCKVHLYSDSAYLVNAFVKGWLEKWQQRGWYRDSKGKEPVLNPDLWKELLALSAKHQVQWNWVKGHAANVENNRCDELARRWISEYYANSGSRALA